MIKVLTYVLLKLSGDIYIYIYARIAGLQKVISEACDLNLITLFQKLELYQPHVEDLSVSSIQNLCQDPLRCLTPF